MHIKHLHCMIEELAGGLKENVTACMQPNEVGIIGATVDMLKDLCEAEYYARMAKCLEKDEEEEKEEEKYLLRMLKEEHGMSEEDSKRFYDAWRYKNGRFAPKGRGTRRGYEEPPYYHMNPEMYKEHDPEWYRDMDRASGKLYFTEPVRTDGMKHDGMAKSDDRYADGYDEGTRRGYEEGYRDGERKGKMKSGSSRYEMAKRGYEEVKEKHKGNTPDDKRMNMAEFEKVLNVVLDELDDMLADAPPEMKNMAKTKGIARLQKIS